MLPGGVRLHAVLPPLADGGPHLSLRFARHRAGGVDTLLRLGAVTPDAAVLLRALVGARASLVVTGGTGAGKTTVLAALLAECAPTERVVVVEDVRELDPHHPHVVRLQGRGPNVEGAGGVTLVDLVRQALRMRPDRLVVGEVRGAEVRELLAALNTGHEGGMSTMHANGPEEVPARFEALGALAGLRRDAVHAQLREALRVVVHVARRGSERRVDRVGVVVPDAVTPGLVRVVTAATSTEGGLLPGPGLDRLVRIAPAAAECCRRVPGVRAAPLGDTTC
jgi:pilus assembly protein CpaF